MDVKPNEIKGGFFWFIGAGFFSVLLVMFLYFVDEKKAHSTKNIEHNNMMKELREAQTGLKSD